MTPFDLLFLVAFLVSLLTLIYAAYQALRGRQAQALSIIKRWALCAITYLGISVAVAALKPQRVIALADPWCFDDWCLTVESFTQTITPPDAIYTTGLRISSRAKRFTQRANGAWIYVRDEKDRHYFPEPDQSATPLDVQLGPGESLTTSRVFKVPAGTREAGLVTGHGGPPCGLMTFLIIGQGGCFFHKETMVRLE